MRHPKIETGGDVVRAVELLTTHFGIQRPEVLAGTGRTSRAFGDAKRPEKPVRLRISPRDWHGVEVATLHEFAHALTFSRGEKGHGLSFFRALVEVADFWLGHAVQYPWETEYLTVYAMARRQGLTSKPHFKTTSRTLPEGVKPFRVGEALEWTSRSGRVVFKGTVLSAYKGCRVKLQTPDGKRWFVPPAMLRRVPQTCEVS